MYNARIVTDNGEFSLGYDYGTVFDISPLNGLDVDIDTQQTFQTIGEYVSGASTAGISREIKGVFTEKNTSLMDEMLSALMIGTSGKLYFNDECYCSFVVEKTPTITRTYYGRYDFDIMLFCADPVWYSANDVVTQNLTSTKDFSYPVTYADAYTFGAVSDSLMSVTNPGNMDTKYSAQFEIITGCTNILLTNTGTLEKLELDGAFDEGDVINLSWDSGTLSIVKNDDTNIFSTLTDDSELFCIHPGGNILRCRCDEGTGRIAATISFKVPYIGVYA